MTRITRIAGFSSALMLSACATLLDEEGALTVVPYEIEPDRGIVVEASINGQGPFAFTLDTAASISVIFDDTNSKLGLESVTENVVVIHGLVTSGEFPLLSIDQLSVGGEVWVDPVIAAMPGQTAASTGVDGILGVDFLKRYAVGFSTDDRVIRLYPPDQLEQKAYRGWTSVPLELLHVGDTRTALYFFEIEVGGVSMPAVFDLGASMNMMNWSAASRLGLDPVELRDDDQVAGAIDNAPIVARIRARELTTGNIRWKNEEFIIAELEIFTTLMQRATPSAILGAGLFTQRDFIIDFARNRLLVKTAMREAENPGSQ